MKRHALKPAWALALIILLVAANVFAQQLATLNVTVNDQSGAVANITLKLNAVTRSLGASCLHPAKERSHSD